MIIYSSGLVELINLTGSTSEFLFLHALGRSVVVHSLRDSRSKVNLMLIIFSSLSSSDGTSEEILVLLLREVDVIVSVRVREFSGVVSVILPGRLRSESLSMGPGLQFQVRDGSVLVVITNLHSSLVCLVIDSFSSEHVLLLFTESFKDVLGANFHDGDFVVNTSFLVSIVLGGAHLVLADLSVATSGNEVRYKGHVLRVLHVRLAH